MAEKWLIYHSKANCWIFYSESLFIVCYKLRPWQELAYAQKRWCKKVGKVLSSTFGVMNQIRRVKGSTLTFMVRSPSFSNFFFFKKAFQKTLHQNPPSSWAIRQWYKKVRNSGCQKTKGKRKEEHFGPVPIQQLFKKLFNSKLTR